MQQRLKIFSQKNRLPCKNRRQAEKGKNYHTHVARSAQRYAPNTAESSHKPRQRRTLKNYHSPVGRTARRQAQTPADTAQAQYRTAGRVLQARSDRSVLAYVTGAASAARRVPAKRDCAVNKKKWQTYKDSNLDKVNQNHLCYRYTIGLRYVIKYTTNLQNCKWIF